LKNLGRAIDRIIKIDPNLEEKLTSIKSRWKKYPSRTMNYWKELIDFLNSDPLRAHPKRQEIKAVINTKPKAVRPHLYSFDPVTPGDTILGVIPENLADHIRKYDRQAIEIAKMTVEASMTKNTAMFIEAHKLETLLDFKVKKTWIELKDTLKLWDKINVSFSIKKNGSVLVITSPNQTAAMPFMGGGNQLQSNNPFISGPGIVKMDESTLRQFMRFLGMEPPDTKKDDDQ